MKCVYKKITTLKIFGIKVLNLNTTYAEHSNDKNSDDDFYIDLTTRELKNND